MTAKAEYDAVYFTRLRAIEERDDLLTYREQLQSERVRLDAISDITQQVDDALPRRLRRPVAQTSKSLLEAIGRRRATVLQELGRIDDRIAAAEAFVTECEMELATMRS